jgi:hypothetical protein
MKQKLRQKATNQMPDEKNTIQIEQEFGCLFLGLYGKKHMGLANGASRERRAAHVQPVAVPFKSLYNTCKIPTIMR